MPSRKETNRKRLYHAAIRLFANAGYDAVSMADIAKAAGLSRASVFNHYPSKQDFLIQFFVELNATIRARLSKTVYPAFPDFIEEFCQTIDDLVVENRGLFREMTILSIPGEKMRETEIREDMDLAQLFEHQISEARDRGEIREAVDPRLASGLFMATLTGTAREWALGTAKDDPGGTLKQYFRLIFSGLQT